MLPSHWYRNTDHPRNFTRDQFRARGQFSEKCGTSVPTAMAQQFEGPDDDPETRSLIAASTVIEQCEDLPQMASTLFIFIRSTAPH